jgi:hypothetical protein
MGLGIWVGRRLFRTEPRSSQFTANEGDRRANRAVTQYGKDPRRTLVRKSISARADTDALILSQHRLHFLRMYILELGR